MTSWRRKQSPANQSRRVVSLLTGKNTGNSRDSGAHPAFVDQIVPMNRALLAEFPKKRNSVFLKLDQGTKSRHQGLRFAWRRGAWSHHDHRLSINFALDNYKLMWRTARWGSRRGYATSIVA